MNNTSVDPKEFSVLAPDQIPDEMFQLLDESEKDSEFVAMESKTYFQDAWGRFRKNKLALISLVFILLMVLALSGAAAVLWNHKKRC